MKCIRVAMQTDTSKNCEEAALEEVENGESKDFTRFDVVFERKVVTDLL
jgi:hypothetical protein